MVANVQTALEALKTAGTAMELVLSAIEIHNKALSTALTSQALRLVEMQKAGLCGTHQYDHVVNADPRWQELQTEIDINTTLWQKATQKRDAAKTAYATAYKHLESVNSTLDTHLDKKKKKTFSWQKTSLVSAQKFWKEADDFLGNAVGLYKIAVT